MPRAWLPNAKFAFVAVELRIVPALRVSALAPMLMPSVSVFVDSTVYRNVNVFVPLPIA